MTPRPRRGEFRGDRSRRRRGRDAENSAEPRRGRTKDRRRRYGVLSRRRKAWFGDADQCRLWDDNWDLRFVDDAVVGLGGAGPVAGAPPAAVGDSVLVATPDPCFGADGSLLNGLQGTVVACRDDDACDTGTLDVVFEDGAAATTMRAVDAAVLRRAVPA